MLALGLPSSRLPETMGNIINAFTLDYLDSFDEENVYDEITIDDDNEYNGPLGIISSMNLDNLRHPA